MRLWRIYPPLEDLCASGVFMRLWLIQPGPAPPAQLNFYPAYRFKPRDVYQEWLQ